MTTTEKRSHGGARPGSGPKKKYEKGRKASASLMVYITDEEKARLDEELARTGEKKTAFIRRLIRAALRLDK